MQPSFTDWLTRTKAGPKPRKRLRPVAARHAAERRAYAPAAARFKKAHPICAVCHTRPTKDVHHTHGRGPHLLDESTWLPVCRQCHDWIHSHPGQAREKGLLL
jgi:cytochrome c553